MTESDATKRKARAEAAAWVVRLHGPRRTAALEAAFRDWLAADDENRIEFEDMTAVWDDARGIPAGPIPRLQQWARPRFVARWAIAATLMLALGLGAITTYRFWFAGMYRTGVGEERMVFLGDGTRVSLNSDTRLEVHFTSHERHVTLAHGEAFFEVVHNASRPFVVSAGNHDVTALGTAFLVRMDAGTTAVTLVEGRITVSNANEETDTALPQTKGLPKSRLSPSDAVQLVTLSPGERLVLARNEPAKLDSPNLDAITAWRRGEVVLAKTTLSDAAAEMNRYEEQQLVIDSPQVAKLRISGIYHVGDNAGFAETIAKLYHLDVTYVDHKIHITSSK
jgi:transmembrane sensor